MFECFKAEQCVILYVYSVPPHTTLWPKLRGTQLSKHFTWTPLLNTWPITPNPQDLAHTLRALAVVMGCHKGKNTLT